MIKNKFVNTEKLKNLLKEKKLTQKELADISGVSRQKISALLNNPEKDITIKILNNLLSEKEIIRSFSSSELLEELLRREGKKNWEIEGDE